MSATSTHRSPETVGPFPDPLALRFETAKCRLQFSGGFRLLFDRYCQSGLCLPNRWRIRVLPLHLRPDTQVFIARFGGEIIGTISLVMEDHGDLPLQAMFEREVEKERRRYHVVAELASLAISPRFSKSRAVFAELTSIAVQFARRQGVDMLLATVHPRHAAVYERAMGFRRVGTVQPHEGVLGRPAALIATPTNQPEAIGQGWREWYFGDRFSDDELIASPMSRQDRVFFRPFVDSSEGLPLDMLRLAK